MDILGSLLQGAMGGGQQADAAAAPQFDVGQIASQFGLSPEQANAAVGALLPAVMGGVQKSEEAGGLANITDIAGQMGVPHEDTDSGNSILGHIFGSKDVSRSVADDAAAQTGISSTIMKAMLPMVAGLVAQQVAKKMGGGLMGGVAASIVGSMLGGSAAQAAAPAQGGLAGMLGGLASSLGGGGANPLDSILGGLTQRQ